jgi:hypothetical protein
MIPFDVRRAPQFTQLQKLFGGAVDPAEVNAQLPAQGRAYINAGAQAMGIGDPVAFFEAQRRAKVMAATPTLPAQLAARDAAADAAMEQEKVAALQLRGGNMFRTPLPTGGAVELPPLATEEAAAQKLTPLNYVLNKRMGEVGVAPSDFDSEGRGRGFTHAPTASDIYGDERFQRLHRNDPNKAKKLFSALTGGDLEGHEKIIAANRVASNVRQRGMFDEGLKTGLLKLENGKLMQRERIPSPDDPNKLVLGPNYGDLDEYHRISWTPCL